MYQQLVLFILQKIAVLLKSLESRQCDVREQAHLFISLCPLLSASKNVATLIFKEIPLGFCVCYCTNSYRTDI